jgi:hypothetical protein
MIVSTLLLKTHPSPLNPISPPHLAQGWDTSGMMVTLHRDVPARSSDVIAL